MSEGPTEPARIAGRITDRIVALPDRGRRSLVAIAGPPGVGKSTVAELVLVALRGQGIGASLVPMDGFHLDNALLDKRGLLPRKGAPETFDAAGFLALLERLTREDDVIYPTFDRGLDKSIAGSGEVTAADEIVLVEGNYLLFDAPVWKDMRAYWTLSVFLTEPHSVLEERLTQRWMDHGHDPREAALRAESNDLRNARLIEAARLPADMVVG